MVWWQKPTVKVRETIFKTAEEPTAFVKLAFKLFELEEKIGVKMLSDLLTLAVIRYLATTNSKSQVFSNVLKPPNLCLDLTRV